MIFSFINDPILAGAYALAGLLCLSPNSINCFELKPL